MVLLTLLWCDWSRGYSEQFHYAGVCKHYTLTTFRVHELRWMWLSEQGKKAFESVEMAKTVLRKATLWHLSSFCRKLGPPVLAWIFRKRQFQKGMVLIRHNAPKQQNVSHTANSTFGSGFQEWCVYTVQENIQYRSDDVTKHQADLVTLQPCRGRTGPAGHLCSKPVGKWLGWGVIRKQPVCWGNRRHCYES